MILIKNGTILTLEGNEFFTGDLAIKGSRIFYVGESKEWDVDFDTVIDGGNFIVMPGFVNTHTHLAMVLMRGLADDIELHKWLNDVVFPIEGKLTKDDVYFGSLLAIVESIKSGVTTVADFYFHMDAVFNAVRETGIRANLGFGLASKFNFDTLKLKVAANFVRNYNGLEDGRVLASFAPHAPYTCSLKFMKAIAERAKEMKVLVHTHLHETEKEIVDFKKQYGTTPIQKLASVGFFDVKVNAAHCVYMGAEDYKILKEHKVGVALNPQSNLKLGSGIPDISEMLKYGINLGIGTDGASSNNNLILLEDMRLVSFLAKGLSRDPQLLPADELLRIATLRGAENIGFSDVGLLEEGYKADIILINKNSETLTPFTNPYSLVAYSMKPGDVDTVIINGKLVMQNRKVLTVDEEIVKKEVRKHYKRLIGS